MGLLDIFRPKEIERTGKRLYAMHGHLQEAFSTVHNHVTAIRHEILQQKEWLRYLHQNHLSLHTHHSDHKELIKTELTKLNSWISFLHKAIQKQDKQLVQLQKTLDETINTYNNHLATMSELLERVHKKTSEKPPVQIIQKEIDYEIITKNAMQDLQNELNILKITLKQELGEALSSVQEQQNLQQQTMQELEEKIEQQQELQKAQKEVQKPLITAPLITEQKNVQWSLRLTNPEQKLLNLLMSESDPLTYTKISQLTGHSINTIRVNMNVLKKKGLIEESTLPIGIKLFSVTNKEKVKKMYNVQIL